MSTEVPTEDTNYAAMSDEEFLNHTASIEVATAPVEVPPSPVEPETSSSVETIETVTTEESQVENPTVETQPASTEENTEQVQVTEGQVNYEDFYKTLTTPFKANGRDFHVTNPHDMITLMQKGADYVKKMTEIKPLRRIGKLLEDNQLSEPDLAYLIDLKNKKPEAIAKLLKDSEVDLFEFDLKQAEGYTPTTTAQVSDEAISLQSTLEDLQATSGNFTQLVAVVGNQWDAQSREVLAQHPQLLRILDQQIADGTFAKIENVLQYERALGRLDGLSDIQAYTEIERRIQQSNPVPVQVPPTHQTQMTPVQIPQDQQQLQQQKVVEQRKQAAPPRQTKIEVNTQFNPAALSDEEFITQLKQAGIY